VKVDPLFGIHASSIPESSSLLNFCIIDQITI
jgi:hypothetical protein